MIQHYTDSCLLCFYITYFNFSVVYVTEQPPHPSAVKSRHLSLFMHVARMNRKADVNQIFLSFCRSSGGEPPGWLHSTWLQKQPVSQSVFF